MTSDLDLRDGFHRRPIFLTLAWNSLNHDRGRGYLNFCSVNRICNDWYCANNVLIERSSAGTHSS